MNTKALSIFKIATGTLGSSVHSLEKGRALSLGVRGESSVSCLRGALWVTSEGLGDDFIVRAGETRRIPGRGRLVISAFENSQLLIA